MLRLKISFPALAVALAVLWTAPAANASIEGSQFDVNVLVPGTGPPADDCFSFEAEGAFCSASGSSGTWTEVDLGIVGVWSVETEGFTASGLQVLGFLIVGAGENSESQNLITFGFVGGDCPCDPPASERAFDHPLPSPEAMAARLSRKALRLIG
jgi:hypothetical protein